mgnify:CR=1 FL=1
MLYPIQEIKAKLQKIYDNQGLVGKTAKATDLKQYLPVVEKTEDAAEAACEHVKDLSEAVKEKAEDAAEKN